MTHASAAFAVYPPSLPTIPVIEAPVSRANFKAWIKLTLIFFSALPPPTENTSMQSFLF
jgi:hypothetical protein